MIEAIFGELGKYFLDAQIRPYRARCSDHDLFDPGSRRQLPGAGLHGTDKHAAIADHCDWAPIINRHDKIRDCRVDTDRRRHERMSRNPATITDLSQCWQAEHCPRRPTTDQIMDITKPQVFEPTRGPSAEISMLIETVNNQGTVRVQIRHGRTIQRLQRL